MEQKFERDNEVFFDYMNWLERIDVDTRTVTSQFPAYVGSVNLARFISIYEAYKEVLSLSGDIADLGTYQGGSFFTFGKLVKIFEPYSNTKVFGFDWFKGMAPGNNDLQEHAGKYFTSKERLLELISRQGFEGLMELFDLDLTQDYSKFLSERPFLRFKLAFIDIGVEEVLSKTVSQTWDRMVPGGILLLDHFNHETSPTESAVVESATGGVRVEQAFFSRSPTGFVRKPERD